GEEIPDVPGLTLLHNFLQPLKLAQRPADFREMFGADGAGGVELFAFLLQPSLLRLPSPYLLDYVLQAVRGQEGEVAGALLDLGGNARERAFQEPLLLLGFLGALPALPCDFLLQLPQPGRV